MAYVYRRPFDVPQHRQAFNVWAMAGLTEGNLGAGTFSTFSASISSTASLDRNSRGTRFPTQGVFRRRWPYAEHQARIVLFYTDADAVDALRGGASFTGLQATVQLGSTSGAAIAADAAEAGFATYTGAIEGGRRDPYALAVGAFTGLQASLQRTAGLGQSRTGATQAKASGTYQPGSTRVRPGRVVSITNRITRAK